MLAISLMPFPSQAAAFAKDSFPPPDLRPSNLIPTERPVEPEIIVIREVVVPTPAAVWTGLSMLAGLGIAAQYAHRRRHRREQKRSSIHRSR